MKVVVITLRRNAERRVKIAARLNALGISPVFVEGVDARELPEEVLSSAVNRFRWWCSTGLEPRPGEIGCALSHMSVYRGMSEQCLCLLEDDAVLSDDFPNELAKIDQCIDSSRAQVILLSNFNGWMRFTDGYIITRSAAEFLLHINTPLKRPCDHWSAWRRQNGLKVIHWPHPIVSQTFETSDTGRAITLEEMTFFHKIVWKLRRIVGLALDELFGLTTTTCVHP